MVANCKDLGKLVYPPATVPASVLFRVLDLSKRCYIIVPLVCKIRKAISSSG